jgi:2-methylisocitrate lyase-like PEP mutase family enzyme
MFLSRRKETTMEQKNSQKLRNLIEGNNGLILRPCAYDALSAILIEKAGFNVIGTTGYGISASLIGQPDIGLIGYAETLERARTIVNAVHRPVEVDADTGYGNAMNVYWTVQNMARIGVAGVRIEDQVWPKRCGHMAGKSVVSVDVMLSKIKAAVEARNEEDPYMVIGARTDIRTITNFEDTLIRAIAYARAGADYVYIEAPQSIEEIKELVAKVPVPVALNIIPGGKTPPFKIDDLEELGVKYLSVPMICLYPAVKEMMKALAELKSGRDLKKIAAMGVDWAEFNDLVGNTKWRELELKTLPDTDIEGKYGTQDINLITKGERESAKNWVTV